MLASSLQSSLRTVQKRRGLREVGYVVVLYFIYLSTRLRSTRASDEDSLRRAVIQKFRTRVEVNTVAPRKLARIARAAHRNEIPIALARSVSKRLLAEPAYSIENAFRDSAAQADLEHGVEQLVECAQGRVIEINERGLPIGDQLRLKLTNLRDLIDVLLARKN